MYPHIFLLEENMASFPIALFKFKSARHSCNETKTHQAKEPGK